MLLSEKEKSTISKKNLECQRLKAIQQLLVYSTSVRKVTNTQKDLWPNEEMSRCVQTFVPQLVAQFRKVVESFTVEPTWRKWATKSRPCEF